MDLAAVMEIFFAVYENMSTYWIACPGPIPAILWDLFITGHAWKWNHKQLLTSEELEH